MPGEYRAPEGDELDERELAALAAERPLVRASGIGPFPGTSLAEAMARIEGELGSASALSAAATGHRMEGDRDRAHPGNLRGNRL